MTFREFITEGLFSKKKDEDFDFAESFLINVVKKAKLKPKGKMKDKSASDDLVINLWQFIEELTLEQKVSISLYLKKFKFKENSAALENSIEGTIVVDKVLFNFGAYDYFDKPNDKKPCIRIYKTKE